MDVIGICDHNSTRNVAAVQRAGAREGVVVIGGIEVCSEEEVHILGLFDDADGIHCMQELVDETPEVRNDPELFGDQLVCGEDDAVLFREPRLLIGATTLNVEEVVDSIHRFGGLAIASHVDRDRFSILSQLGFVPDGLPIDALEISPQHSLGHVVNEFPRLAGYPLVTFSDAHHPEEIGVVSTIFRSGSTSVGALREALAGEVGRPW